MKRDDATERGGQSPATGQSRSEAGSNDVALLCGRTADGSGVNVLRCRDGVVSAGAVRPLVEGQPIHGEVVRLTPRPDAPRVCDVTVELEPPEASRAGRKGPAQVASDVYRRNWEAIFERRPSEPELTN